MQLLKSISTKKQWSLCLSQINCKTPSSCKTKLYIFNEKPLAILMDYQSSVQSTSRLFLFAGPTLSQKRCRKITNVANKLAQEFMSSMEKTHQCKVTFSFKIYSSQICYYWWYCLLILFRTHPQRLNDIVKQNTELQKTRTTDLPLKVYFRFACAYKIRLFWRLCQPSTALWVNFTESLLFREHKCLSSSTICEKLQISGHLSRKELIIDKYPITNDNSRMWLVVIRFFY